MAGAFVAQAAPCASSPSALGDPIRLCAPRAYSPAFFPRSRRSLHNKSDRKSDFAGRTWSDKKRPCQFFIAGNCRHKHCNLSHDVSLLPPRAFLATALAEAGPPAGPTAPAPAAVAGKAASSPAPAKGGSQANATSAAHRDGERASSLLTALSRTPLAVLTLLPPPGANRPFNYCSRRKPRDRHPRECTLARLQESVSTCALPAPSVREGPVLTLSVSSARPLPISRHLRGLEDWAVRGRRALQLCARRGRAADEPRDPGRLAAPEQQAEPADRVRLQGCASRASLQVRPATRN